jgi:D-alanyl-lipoteichoic acid acyltransferase DltB (MBOAT superfamily)
MLFTTGLFLFVFLPLALGMFFLAARFVGLATAAACLVLASLFFYGFWRPIHVLLLMASVCVNYYAGGLILNARQRQDGRAASRLLAGSVGANLLVLAYFKYLNFFEQTVGWIAGVHLPGAAIALPLGISFFTFTQIAYLVDVYAGKVVERSPVRYALFVTYFPHLIAGPVLHHAQMMPQFKDPAIYVPQPRPFVLGVSFLLLGMAKKVLIADSFAPIADQSFADAAQHLVATAEAWSGILAYTLQIYFDFSGYSDMAVGLSLLIGVRLPYNFNSPYRADSIVEFWRRWHMTLSAFLRDYLYIGLGGNRKGPARRYVNLFVTMLLGGLWHGASWTFVVWGGLHGLYLAVNHGWRWVQGRVAWPATAAGQTTAALRRWLSRALTLLCVILAWVFFRATDFESAARMLEAMFGLAGAPAIAAPYASVSQWIWLAAFMTAAITLPNSQQLIDGRVSKWLNSLSPSQAYPLAWFLSSCLLVGVAMLAAIAASRYVTEFIYFNF